MLVSNHRPSGCSVSEGRSGKCCLIVLLSWQGNAGALGLSLRCMVVISIAMAVQLCRAKGVSWFLAELNSQTLISIVNLVLKSFI